mgnify:CR=1 FL=1|jgi:hypothetical protein
MNKEFILMKAITLETNKIANLAFLVAPKAR